MSMCYYSENDPSNARVDTPCLRCGQTAPEGQDFCSVDCQKMFQYDELVSEGLLLINFNLLHHEEVA